MLRLADVPTPVPKDDEVLVKVVPDDSPWPSQAVNVTAKSDLCLRLRPEHGSSRAEC